MLFSPLQDKLPLCRDRPRPGIIGSVRGTFRNTGPGGAPHARFQLRTSTPGWDGSSFSSTTSASSAGRTVPQ
jgi:hypothetical protein